MRAVIPLYVIPQNGQTFESTPHPLELVLRVTSTRNTPRYAPYIHTDDIIISNQFKHSCQTTPILSPQSTFLVLYSLCVLKVGVQSLILSIGRFTDTVFSLRRQYQAIKQGYTFISQG